MDAQTAYMIFFAQKMAQNQPRDPNPPPQQPYYQGQALPPPQGRSHHPQSQPQQFQAQPAQAFLHPNDSGPSHAPTPGHPAFTPQRPRQTPMRLDLPPPPVFTAPAFPNNDYPDQYGPPTAYPHSPMGLGQPSPYNLQTPYARPDQPIYSPSYPTTGTGQQASSIPSSSPYDSIPTPGYAHSQAYLQHQQRQHQQQQPQPRPQHHCHPQTPYADQGGPSQPVPPALISPYLPTPQHPQHMITSSSSNGSGNGTEYFPPFPQDLSVQQQQQSYPSQPLVSPSVLAPLGQPIPHNHATPLQPNMPTMTSSTSTRAAIGPTAGHSGPNGPKTSRQQFTACGACRHRRVKCDLKDRQEEAELLEHERTVRGTGPVRNNAPKRKNNSRISCSNCIERNMQCVDEFAPMKIAKQLRRGKRISEIETLYGKNAAGSSSKKGKSRETEEALTEPTIPELTAEFFESGFFRRFQVQRPILDPTDFVRRYLSYDNPCAENLGPEGALLCHVLYAWATSYGVDEHGNMDIPEGGTAPLRDVNLLEPGKNELEREEQRNIRFAKMRVPITLILEEIDACGIMRKPSWDGARVLLLFLPLTEGISTPVERLAMYECALSQVFMLCSFDAIGYDGKAAGTSGANGGSDSAADDGRDMNTVRIRTYWYAFVHEGITTGLKGGRLSLDGDDLQTMQDAITNKNVVATTSTKSYRTAAKMATAPINLALACRLINRALTGPTAKRRTSVNANHVKEAWEALEACWEEFESIRHMTTSPEEYKTEDEIIRFVDGWKIFLFEAQNVIRNNLDERLTKLNNTATSAFIVDPSSTNSQQDDLDIQMLNIVHLLDISKDKCDIQTRQIMAIVRHHLGTSFFEWDASLVRDGVYYAAMLLAKRNGSDDDICCCIQALNELRWAHAKAWSRSADLRREWGIRSAHSSVDPVMMGWDGSTLSTGNHMYPQRPVQFAGNSSGDTSLSINTSLNTRTSTRSNPNANSLGTGSSHSNSPYTSSSSLVSPVYDPSGGMKMGLGPLAAQQQQIPQSQVQWLSSQSMTNMGPPAPVGVSSFGHEGFYDQHPHQQQQYQDGQYQHTVQTPMTYQNVHGLDLMQMPGQQDQGQNQSGGYVFQADGSQVFVPYEE